MKNPTFDEFVRIFESCCRRYNLDFDPVIVDYLHRSYYLPRGIEKRACHPRDLVEQVVSLCRFQNREPAITRDLLDAACTSYFLADAPQVPSTSGPGTGEDGAWA